MVFWLDSSKGNPEIVDGAARQIHSGVVQPLLFDGTLDRNTISMDTKREKALLRPSIFCYREPKLATDLLHACPALASILGLAKLEGTRACHVFSKPFMWQLETMPNHHHSIGLFVFHRDFAPVQAWPCCFGVSPHQSSCIVLVFPLLSLQLHSNSTSFCCLLYHFFAKVPGTKFWACIPRLKLAQSSEDEDSSPPKGLFLEEELLPLMALLRPAKNKHENKSQVVLFIFDWCLKARAKTAAV